MKATPEHLELMRKAIKDSGPICWRITVPDHSLAESMAWDMFCADYIESTLDYHAYYTCWLKEEGFDSVQVQTHKEAGRTAWLRDMIAAAERGDDLPSIPSLPDALKEQ